MSTELINAKELIPPRAALNWVASLREFRADEAAMLARAYTLAQHWYGDKKIITGEYSFDHARGTAAIVARLAMDAEAIAAGLLYPAWDHVDNPGVLLRAHFNDTVVALVEGVSKMEQAQQYGMAPSQEEDKRAHKEQLGALGKMLLAMVQDVRIVIIKLAERTQTMRALAHAEEEIRRYEARVTRDVYAPLANRLGIWQLKWELEDLALRYLDPELYQKITQLLDERRVDRERYIQEVVEMLKRALAQAEIETELSGRPKHISSIVNKMQRKNLDFNQVYDTRAVRILVQQEKDCYAALGVVHNLWQPIPGEFDDYISRPKNNAYRSLHTAVVGPHGKALEIQIRTYEMHHHADLGLAAHWRYKEGRQTDSKFDQKIAWLRQLLDWKEDLSHLDWVEQFDKELFEEDIYVLTPQGKVIDLPQGATPIDFAYRVHTSLGDRCRGAKVDGHIVPLNTPLKNAQRVEIIAVKQGGPSRDWLNPKAGYIKSARARAKIRHWFKYEHKEEDVAAGRDILERELHRVGVTSLNHEKLTHKFSYSKLDEFLAAVGRGDISIRQLGAAITDLVTPPAALSSPAALPKSKVGAAPNEVVIQGVGNLLTTLAKCCKPAPPDRIMGFITRGRGIMIHKKQCVNISNLNKEREQRLLNASWAQQASDLSATVEILAEDHHNLLHDICAIFARDKIRVDNIASQRAEGEINITLETLPPSLTELEHAISVIQKMEAVREVRRR